MFVSVTFPVADLRELHPTRAGRLIKPSWGESDPKASFARGFGAIHIRNKRDEGLLGESFYADCNNLLKYPKQIFVLPLRGNGRKILTYPIYRRFYFDGQFSGRFEFGFRLNEATIQEICTFSPEIAYDAAEVAKQVLTVDVRAELLDGRVGVGQFYRCGTFLRDGYILSSTQRRELTRLELAEIAERFVSVGSPFVFIRSGVETPIILPKRQTTLRTANDNDYALKALHSGVQSQRADTILLSSSLELTAESAQERIARLFYVQLRCVIFSHSFYLNSFDAGNIESSQRLCSALKKVTERIRLLLPVEADSRDRQACEEMREIIANSNVYISTMVDEIEKRLKPSKLRLALSKVSSYLDRKSNTAIEAAASAATKQMLGGS